MRDSRTSHPPARDGADAGGARRPEALRLVRRPGPGRHERNVQQARVPLAARDGAAWPARPSSSAGLLFAAGLLTPLAALALIVVMLNAIITVHWPKGFFVTAGGYEYNLTIVAIAAVVSAIGPGRDSLDNALGIAGTLSGVWWAPIVLAAARRDRVRDDHARPRAPHAPRPSGRLRRASHPSDGGRPVARAPAIHYVRRAHDERGGQVGRRDGRGRCTGDARRRPRRATLPRSSACSTQNPALAAARGPDGVSAILRARYHGHAWIAERLADARGRARPLRGRGARTRRPGRGRARRRAGRRRAQRPPTDSRRCTWRRSSASSRSPRCCSSTAPPSTRSAGNRRRSSRGHSAAAGGHAAIVGAAARARRRPERPPAGRVRAAALGRGRAATT